MVAIARGQDDEGSDAVQGRTTPETPAQPHDVLAKKIFSNPQNARVELQAVLPRELVSAIDWSTLEVLPDTFIRPAFAKTHADLLFRVTRGCTRRTDVAPSVL